MLWGQHLIWKPSIGLLCWLQKSGPKDLGLLPYLRGSSGIQMGPVCGGNGAGDCRQSVGRRLSISLGKCATVFLAVICAILACAYEIQMNARPEKYVSICSDSQASLKAFQTFKHPHWYSSARRQWMTFPPGILRDCSRSLDILGYVEMKLPISSQERELVTSLLDLNQSWQFLDRI
jgi:hypothetical protein